MSRKNKSLRTMGVWLAVGCFLTTEGKAFTHAKTGEPMKGFFPGKRGNSYKNRVSNAQLANDLLTGNITWGPHKGRKTIIAKAQADGKRKVEARKEHHKSMPKLFIGEWNEGHIPFIMEGSTASRFNKMWKRDYKLAVGALKDAQWRWQQADLKFHRLQRELKATLESHEALVAECTPQYQELRKAHHNLLAESASERGAKYFNNTRNMVAKLLGDENYDQEQVRQSLKELDEKPFTYYTERAQAEIAQEIEVVVAKRRALVHKLLASRKTCKEALAEFVEHRKLTMSLWYLGTVAEKNAEMKAFYDAYPVRNNTVRQYA